MLPHDTTSYNETIWRTNDELGVSLCLTFPFPKYCILRKFARYIANVQNVIYRKFLKKPNNRNKI